MKNFSCPDKGKFCRFHHAGNSDIKCELGTADGCIFPIGTSDEEMTMKCGIFSKYLGLEKRKKVEDQKPRKKGGDEHDIR